MKLELILVALIVITSSVTMTTKLSEKNIKTAKGTKELEFTNTTFTEVTTKRREGVAYTTHGVRISGVLYMKNLRYHNDKIKLLLADSGISHENKIYLDGNVSVHQKEAHDYYTEHAIYDKKAEILHVVSPFVACLQQNVFEGETLDYYMQRKEATGTKIDAVIYTEENDIMTYTCQDALKKLALRTKKVERK